MVPVLLEVARQTEGEDVFLGVEDFPLDASALDFYRDPLSPLLKNPRFGTLIDLGHMNLRLRGGDYYRGWTVEGYLAGVPRRIFEVHVHDNAGDRDSHAHIGYGNIDFAAAARGLRAVGFAGISTIEVSAPFYNATADQARRGARESLTRWREHLKAAAEN
jgi:sugar phosphate isomerase/epimerase